LPKREIPKLEGLSEDQRRFLNTLYNEQEFVQIVVGTAYLDVCLGGTLQRFLAESSVSDNLLDSRGGPLGSFAARCHLCYCLGLLEKVPYQDLIKIGEIRNTLAHHHFALDFSHAEVSRLCGEPEIRRNSP
jgi:hypothetical protein